eukprot:SAG31_NODE_488_length_14964_cov_56.443458_11_plen_129_part_00
MLKERLPYQPPTGVFDNVLFAGVQLLQERPTNVPASIKLSARAIEVPQLGPPQGYAEALQRQALQYRQKVQPKNGWLGDPGEPEQLLEAVLEEAGLDLRCGRLLTAAGFEKVSDLCEGKPEFAFTTRL